MKADERRARDSVRRRSGGLCELCGAPATNFQHRKNRSQGGLWLPSNGLDVCGSGTTGCHGHIHQNPALSYRLGHMVHRAHDPARVPVSMRSGFVYGWFLLDDEGNAVPTSPPDSTEEAA